MRKYFLGLFSIFVLSLTTLSFISFPKVSSFEVIESGESLAVPQNFSLTLYKENDLGKLAVYSEFIEVNSSVINVKFFNEKSYSPGRYIWEYENITKETSSRSFKEILGIKTFEI